MPTPDDIVAAHGDDITITRVTSADVGRDGTSSVVREYEQTTGVVSSPSETDTQRGEGRVDTGDLQVTVQSDTDVAVERQGGRDRIILGHIDPATATDIDAYSVIDKSDDTHNIVGITKLTLQCERWTGDNLQDDASSYNSA